MLSLQLVIPVDGVVLCVLFEIIIRMVINVTDCVGGSIWAEVLRHQWQWVVLGSTSAIHHTGVWTSRSQTMKSPKKFFFFCLETILLKKLKDTEISDDIINFPFDKSDCAKYELILFDAANVGININKTVR